MEAAIAPDGTTVACCAGGGEIILIDVAGGHTRATLRGDFAMITKLEFSADGTHLLGQEQYGHGRLLCFDLDSLALRADWPTLAEMTWSDFALSPDNSRLAVTHRAGVEIFDWASMTSRLRFRLDHVVKRCKIAWVGGRLGVQTDYGCAGLYVVT